MPHYRSQQKHGDRQVGDTDFASYDNKTKASVQLSSLLPLFIAAQESEHHPRVSTCATRVLRRIGESLQTYWSQVQLCSTSGGCPDREVVVFQHKLHLESRLVVV